MGLNKRASLAVLKTLAYADIFDYPLTDEEICRWLIGSLPLISSNFPLSSLNKELSKLTQEGDIAHKDNLYFLPGREKITTTRAERKRWSLEKLKIAKKTANKLKIIPWIKMIGITGALAMRNCDEDGDIDLVIITTKDRLWLTRLMILFLSPFLGIKRRKPKETDVRDKICFNLFLDEEYLKIEPKNLFTAHEICQVMPLINKDKTYERLLWENKWVGRFLPNAVNIRAEYKGQSTKEKYRLISQYLDILISFLERLAYKLQYLYMKPKITNENVSPYQAFFHPALLGKKIEEEFESRSKRYNITDD